MARSVIDTYIQEEERTSFQEAGHYDPVIDNRADVAMVYGLNRTFEERVARWPEAGYRIHVMTGVSWGSYQDYIRGEWDERSQTVLIRFAGNPKGITVEVSW